LTSGLSLRCWLPSSGPKRTIVTQDGPDVRNQTPSWLHKAINGSSAVIIPDVMSNFRCSYDVFSCFFCFLFFRGTEVWRDSCMWSCCTLLIRVHNFSVVNSHIHCKERKGEVKLKTGCDNVGSNVCNVEMLCWLNWI